MNITIHSPWTSLRQTFPIRKSEWALSLAAIACWAVFAFNEDLFAENAGYNMLAHYATQETWKWFCFFIGFTRFTILFINGSYWRTPHLRAITAFLSILLWYNLFLGLMPNGAVGLVFAGTLLVLDAFNFRQATIEASISEALHTVEREQRGGPR